MGKTCSTPSQRLNNAIMHFSQQVVVSDLSVKLQRKDVSKGRGITHSTALIVHPYDRLRRFRLVLLRALVVGTFILPADCLAPLLTLVLVLHGLLGVVALSIIPFPLHSMIFWVSARPAWSGALRALGF